DDDADVVRAGGDQGAGDAERAAAGRARVLDVEEGKAGQPEDVDHRVGVAGVLAAAGRELDVVPRDARVGERVPHRRGALCEAGDALVPRVIRVNLERGNHDAVGLIAPQPLDVRALALHTLA